MLQEHHAAMTVWLTHTLHRLVDCKRAKALVVAGPGSAAHAMYDAFRSRALSRRRKAAKMGACVRCGRGCSVVLPHFSVCVASDYAGVRAIMKGCPGLLNGCLPEVRAPPTHVTNAPTFGL